jgi:phage terminase large subunit-like protein
VQRRGSSPAEVGAEWATLLRLLPGYDPFACPGDAWFDPDAAQTAIDFVHECVRHVEGDLAGKPFLLQPWQQSFIANLFGWKRRDVQGREVRRYRETLLYVPRKNGKTPLSAALALYVFFCDPEAGQQNYVAAADRDQAGLLFRQCKGMVEAEPELARRCRVYGGTASAGQSRSIVREGDGSFLRVISADADSKHGGNSHLVLIDELHAQPNRDLVDVLQTSMASANRKQPLLVHITTADYHRPSICNEKHDYACKVRDGIIDDPTFLPVVYEATPDDDWTSPETWAKANPNLGVSVSPEYLERETIKAGENPAYEQTFKRLHLNLKTDSAVTAVPMDRWDACPVIDPADLEGRECWGGLDLSTTTDLSALALLFPVEITAELAGFLALLFFWAPRERARYRSRRDRVPYEAWAREGHIKLTAGDVVDYDVIRQDIGEIGQRYNVREIAADRWNSTQLLTQLAGDGFEVIGYGQGFASMTAPTKELLGLVTAGRFSHGGNPVLRWMASNLATESDAAGNLKPSKKKSSDRIDGMVAVIMALGRAMVAPAGGSVYDSQGITTL